MSSKNHHIDPIPEMQEVDLNDAAWSEVVTTRLPANLEEQARQLNAWKRKREVRRVNDLLRALLVYACCQYSFRELGMWAVLKGIGSLSERAWRKRLEKSRRWIAWRLGRAVGCASNAQLAARGSGTGAAHRCHALENTGRHGR